MQLVIIMVVKPIFINILLYLMPIIMVAFNKKEAKKTMEDSKEKTRWEEDFKLLPESEVSYDYVQLVIQFGFVTLFSSAFPLAALFAFVNNLFELRRDAQKYTKFHRRPIPRRIKVKLV